MKMASPAVIVVVVALYICPFVVAVKPAFEIQASP
jgi:hypothetical protein